MTDEIDWYKWDEEKEAYVFNHRDDGAMRLDAPIPRSELQRKSWKGARWYKERVSDEEPISGGQAKVTALLEQNTDGKGCNQN